MPDLSNWLNADEVCARLGISNRTLDREVAAGHIPSEKRPRPGARPERVFDPAIIDARQKPRNGTVVIAPSVPANPPAVAQTAELLPGLPAFASLIEMLAESKRPLKPWVGLREASRDTGLSRAFLLRLIDEGKLDAIEDGEIKVHRGNLEYLDVSSELMKPARKGKR